MGNRLSLAISQKGHREQLAAFMTNNAGAALFGVGSGKPEREYVTLESVGLEEEQAEPVFGGFYTDSTEEHCSGSVYDYTNWLMDGQLNLED